MWVDLISGFVEWLALVGGWTKADWFEFAGVGVSVLGFLGVILTFYQKTQVDRRTEWWKRYTWAEEFRQSDSGEERAIALDHLTVLVSSKLATRTESKVIQTLALRVREEEQKSLGLHLMEEEHESLVSRVAKLHESLVVCASELDESLRFRESEANKPPPFRLEMKREEAPELDAEMSRQEALELRKAMEEQQSLERHISDMWRALERRAEREGVIEVLEERKGVIEVLEEREEQEYLAGLITEANGFLARCAERREQEPPSLREKRERRERLARFVSEAKNREDDKRKSKDGEI